MKETTINMVSEATSLKELGEAINKINSSKIKELQSIEISESGNHAFIYYAQKWLIDEEGRLKRIKEEDLKEENESNSIWFE